jgi:hypothetical protein
MGLRRLTVAIGEVGTVEAGGEDRRVLQMQVLDDVGLDAGRRGGGEGHRRRVGHDFAQPGKLAVFRTEIMAPLRNAVRLVDGQATDVPIPQVLRPAVQHQALGGGIEQPKFPAVQAAQAGAGLLTLERGVEKRGGDATGAQRVDLVLHQCDQRRNDDCKSGSGEGWQLKAE